MLCLCCCVDEESDTTSCQSSVRPTTSGVNGISLPVLNTAATSTGAFSRSGSSASVKMMASTDTTKTAVVDSRKHGNLYTEYVTYFLISVLFVFC